MENEIENLSEHCRILHKAYQDTKSPLAIAEKCLLAREGRRGIDQVSNVSFSAEFKFFKRLLQLLKNLPPYV